MAMDKTRGHSRKPPVINAIYRGPALARHLYHEEALAKFSHILLMDENPAETLQGALEQSHRYQAGLNALLPVSHAVLQRPTFEDAASDILHQIRTLTGACSCVLIMEGVTPSSKITVIEIPTKEVGNGTGLGLSITYDIAKKHGGDIKVESEVGKGTTFTVSIPIVEER